ncbi:unnamed protein product [Nesidiocoris tenuis]|uniref:PHD-type domain-containing protein n=1 Tax=Nesidiocoris tenuis TaxID=355587 RepID=A0A6H5HHN2_9HEMI|nr:unnamed protein product [Nesidiocoris tenuis]
MVRTKRKEINPTANCKESPPKKTNPKKKKDSCPVCGGRVTDDDLGLLCEGKCASWYHCGCAGMSKSIYDNLSDDDSWICGSCSSNSGGPIAQPAIVPGIGHIDFSSQNSSSLSLTSKMNEVVQVVMELQKSIVFQSAKFDEFSHELRNMKQEHLRIIKDVDSLKDTNRRLMDENGTLALRVSELEQAALSNELEISGVTESADERLPDILHAICAQLNCPLERQEILSVYRPQPSRKRQNQKSLPVVVVLLNRFVRQRIVDAKRKHGNLSCSDIKLPSHEKIFINERLTPANRSLFWLSRQTKQLGYKYCWVNIRPLCVPSSIRRALRIHIYVYVYTDIYVY